MLSDIVIHRDFQIINGFVQYPPNFVIDKTNVTVSQAYDTVTGSRIIQGSLGSGNCTGSKFGAQQIFRLPAVNAGQSYETQYGFDPQQELNP